MVVEHLCLAAVYTAVCNYGGNMCKYNTEAKRLIDNSSDSGLVTNPSESLHAHSVELMKMLSYGIVTPAI